MSKLKTGDKVTITYDSNQLNSFMEQYSGEEATVVSVIDGSNCGQIAKIDIDGGEWDWSYEDKLNQLIKIK